MNHESSSANCELNNEKIQEINFMPFLLQCIRTMEDPSRRRELNETNSILRRWRDESIRFMASENCMICRKEQQSLHVTDGKIGSFIIHELKNCTVAISHVMMKIVSSLLIFILVAQESCNIQAHSRVEYTLLKKKSSFISLAYLTREISRYTICKASKVLKFVFYSSGKKRKPSTSFNATMQLKAL